MLNRGLPDMHQLVLFFLAAGADGLGGLDGAREIVDRRRVFLWLLGAQILGDFFQRSVGLIGRVIAGRVENRFDRVNLLIEGFHLSGPICIFVELRRRRARHRCDDFKNGFATGFKAILAHIGLGL